MAEDPQLRDLSCDPRARKVLVTDGESEIGQSLVRALVENGAETVWAGRPDAGSKHAGFDALTRLKQVTPVSLDVTNAKSVRDLAASLGARVDILINNAEFHRAHGIASEAGTEAAHSEMEVNYFGLLRLAQEFGGAMRTRGAQGQSSAVAWVNVLSIYALANFPSHGTFSASKAAAHSLSQCLRAELRPSGIRVVNVFPGPVEGEWSQLLQSPKLAPEALARAICRALRDGVEDVYPGDVAQEWLAKWEESPGVLERELAQ